jgi:eukaryotic-like serine/threonine-protein kinase
VTRLLSLSRAWLLTRAKDSLPTAARIIVGVAIIVFALDVVFLVAWIAIVGASGKQTVTQAAAVAGVAAVVAVIAPFPVAAGGSLVARAWSSRNGRAGLAEQLKVTVDGRPPTAAQVNDLERLGIHAAREIVGGTGAGTRAMPQYIGRDIDHDLVEALLSERFVLVVGQSTAGKSRAAFHAVKTALPKRRIVAPVLGALTSIIDNRDVPRRSVLWLDDLDRYLTDGFTPQRLNVVMALRSVVVVATIRDVQYEEYRPNDAQSRQERQEVAAGREVLDRARLVRLQRRFSHEELDRADAFRDDERIVEAIEHADRFGVAEYIAAGPDLLGRWVRAQDVGGHPAGAAIVEAAIDCRRAGWPGPIAAQMLQRLHGHYLDRYGGVALRPESFADALTWATVALHGTTGLLNPEGTGYTPFDYLVDAVQADKSASAVPDVVWDAVIAAASPDAAYSVGVATDRAGRAEQAEALFRRSADAGSYHSMIELGMRLMTTNREAEAIERLSKAAAVGNGDAMIALAYLATCDGNAEDADAWLAKAASAICDPVLLASFAMLAATTPGVGVGEDWVRGAANVSEPQIAAALRRIMSQ